MQFQDALAVFYLLLTLGFVARGATGPRHNETHWGIMVSAILMPFAAFDLGKLDQVPMEAWAFCAFGVGAQLVYGVFHKVYDQSSHSRGPEIVFQPALMFWTMGLRGTIDPDVWYREEVGIFLFCFQGIFIGLAVLMVVYVSEGTSLPGDRIDLVKNEFNSKSNAALLAVGPPALLLTLYVVFQQPLLVVIACVVFGVLRVATPMAEGEIPRKA
jgi:hypothetical protein